MTPETAPIWNEETLRTIREARQGMNLRGPFHSVEELIEDLEAKEDEEDLKAYQEAIKEYEANPITYTHEEVGRMLGLTE